MHIVAADERVKRMLYISQLNGNEHVANPPSIKPYRVEMFIPSDNLSVICYNTQNNITRFDVGNYLARGSEMG